MARWYCSTIDRIKRNRYNVTGKTQGGGGHGSILPIVEHVFRRPSWLHVNFWRVIATMGIQQINLFQRDVLLGYQLMNTFYGGNISSDHDDGLAMAALLLSEWEDLIAPVQDINIELFAYEVREVSIAHVPGITYQVGPPIEGQVAGSALPPQVAVYCSLRAASPPPNKSPKWIGGLPETHAVNGVPSSTLLSAVDSFLENLIQWNDTATATQQFCCVHWDDASDRVTAANVAVGRYVNPLFRTQRRRSLYIGI